MGRFNDAVVILCLIDERIYLFVKDLVKCFIFLLSLNKIQNLELEYRRINHHSFDIHYSIDKNLEYFALLYSSCHKSAGNGSKLPVIMITVSF